MIPGSNLLNMALSVIQPTSGAAYQAYVGEIENDMGTTVNTYGPTTPLFGASIQPLTMAQVQVNGLAIDKNYVTVWMQNVLEGAYRGRQCDRILWNNATWEVLPESNWMVQDGWKTVTAVML